MLVSGGILASLVILVDRLSKLWVRAQLTPNASTPFLPGFVGFRYTENSGIAFSFLRDAGAWLLPLLGAVVFGLFLYLLFGSRHLHAAFALPLWAIWGAAVGNLWDRFAYGAVQDFLEFEWITFPIFNVADAVLSLSVVLLALAIFLHKEGGYSDAA